MAVTIVNEIISEAKGIISALLPTYKPIDYEHDITKNSATGLTDRFGFIPRDASFVEGSALGSTTMDHVFQLILVTDYQNKDDDAAQSAALQKLYADAHEVLKDLQKKSLNLPTPGYRVLLISGLSFDNPEHFNDNGVTVIRADFNIKYRFRNN